MDKKISELNVAIDLTDADVLPIVNGGETKKVTIAKLKESMPQAPTKTSDLVNDGSNGTYPFITINDVPVITDFVPYTGATQDLNLGEFGLQTGNIEFDLTPTNVPTNVGSMLWNDTCLLYTSPSPRDS